MKCATCGNEMREGVIEAGNRIAWVPEVTKASVEPCLNKDSVILSTQNRSSINHVKAFPCVPCEQVLLDYSKAD